MLRTIISKDHSCTAQNRAAKIVVVTRVVHYGGQICTNLTTTMCNVAGTTIQSEAVALSAPCVDCSEG